MEQIETEEYIKGHISRVRRHINTFIQLLIRRAENHDKSKLEEPELSWWKEMDKEPRYPYGSEEYKQKIKRWNKVFKHHYQYNRHHPEHYEYGISEMTLIDIVEMMCDWLGYKDTTTVTEALNVCDDQMARYNISEELRQIIFNTLLRYYSLMGGKNPNFDDNSYVNTPQGVLEELNPITSEEKEKETYIYGGRKRNVDKVGKFIDVSV